MDLGNPLGGGSHTSTIHEAYVIYPSEETNFTSPSREKKKKRKKDFLLAQQQLSQWETITTQSVKGHQNSKLSFFSNELSLNIALPNFLHSSI